MFARIVTIDLICFLGSLTCTSGLSSERIKLACSNPNEVSLVGGTHDRLVVEGGRITLTCCIPGITNGHDHEQLVWYDPRGKELPNHFANPQSKLTHMAYSVPDFRSRNHLVSMLVIQRFQREDTGAYSCQKANEQSGISPTVVSLDIRPRLLADYVPMESSQLETSDSEIVAGRPVFVALEEGHRGEISCRLNPNLTDTEIYLTWFFQGRQLIVPSLAMTSGNKRRRPPDRLKENPFDDSNHENIFPFVVNNLTYSPPNQVNENPMQQFIGGHERPVSVDPSEFGIKIADRGQRLQIQKVDNRHTGMYICKAEAVSQLPQSDSYDTSGLGNEGNALSSLIQLQAIRGIVFSPPRILPGNPLELTPPLAHDSVLVEETYSRRRKREALRTNEHAHTPMSPAPRYYMKPVSTNVFQNSVKTGQAGMRKLKSIAQEGEQMVLECQARGNPSPNLLWYRGGMGSTMLTESKLFTFDQRIKEALQYMPLEEVQRQLGILIADSTQLFPAITISDGIDEVDKTVPVSDAPIDKWNVEDLKTFRLGRFELSVARRKDDTGNPVISVSRLTIKQLKPTDATRYTCLALMDLSQFGGSGNYTDVGSVFPEVVLRPRFIKSGTQLLSGGYPHENATLTCEVFGGLPTPLGLRIRLLRGPSVPRLIRILTGFRQQHALGSDERHKPDMLSTQNDFVQDVSTDLKFNPAYPVSSRFTEPKFHHLNEVDYTDDYAGQIRNGLVEILRPGMNPRYQLSVTTDPRNPYISILRLHIHDLRPEDNAFYACEALSGPHWRAIAPTPQEGTGRVTVWFAPPGVVVKSTFVGDLDDSDSNQTGNEKSKGLVYGLSHLPSKLVCQALGQPPPTWTWSGPQTGPDVALGDPNGPKGYKKFDYQDGEMSVTELLVPAAYWNVGVFGTYACLATNRLGSATGHIRLKLATHPGRPSMRACKVEAKMIDLCVDPPEQTGGLPLTHYELRIQTHPRDAFYGPFAYLPGRRLLRLPHLIPGYYYRFALSAVSAAGRGPNAYLQVTTNRLVTPAIQMQTSPEYIEPTAYSVHWKTAGNNGPEIEEYKINVRPVEVDDSVGEVTGRPIGSWTEYSVVSPNCKLQSLNGESASICSYRVAGLTPDNAYELELSGHNSRGFSEAQRIIFKTSTISGESGRVLNMPSYLRQTSSNTAYSIHFTTFSIVHLWLSLTFVFIRYNERPIRN